MKRSLPWLLSGPALLILFACDNGSNPAAANNAGLPNAGAPAKQQPAAPKAAGTATVSGKVTFDGKVPPPEKIDVNADPACAAANPNGIKRQAIRVKDGAVADVVVYVKKVAGNYPPSKDPVVVDQKGCDYDPDVVVVQVGQPVKFVNNDDTLHNVHPRPAKNEEWNESQPTKGQELLKTFTKPEEMIPLGCEVHAWMRAYITVVENPFFTVTAQDGTFTLKGLPAGEYEVVALHPKLKSLTQKVKVKDGETAKLDFAFKG